MTRARIRGDALPKNARASRDSSRQADRPGSPRWLIPAIAIGIALANLAIYTQTLGFSYVNFDDDRGLFKNPWVQHGLGGPAVQWAFTTLHLGNWIPVSWLSHLLDFTLFGANAGAHHLVSVAFHITNALLLFGLMIRWTGAIGPSAAATLFWSLHPLRVESVAWIIERKDVLSTFFALLAIYLYSRYVDSGSRARYIGALIAMLVGLLAKPMLVTLPFLLILLDLWPFGRLKLGWSSASMRDEDRQARPSAAGSISSEPSPRAAASSRRDARAASGSGDASKPSGRRTIADSSSDRATLSLGRVVAEKIPFIGLSVFGSVVSLYAQRHGGAVLTLEQLPWTTRAGNALVSSAVYLTQTVWPRGLAVYYPYDLHLPSWQILGAALLLGAITSLALWAALRMPGLLVGWLWYLGALIPVLGFVQVGAQAHADRYTYLPSIGLSLAGLVLLLALTKRVAAARAASTWIWIGISVLYGVAAWLQTGYWKDSIALFQRTLAVAGDNNAVAHDNLAAALAQQGRHDEAIVQYRETLKVAPHFPGANADLGLELFNKGMTEDAVRYYRAELTANPSNADAHCHLGVALAVKGQMESALEEFNEALRIRPDYADAKYNQARAYESLDRIDEAAGAYERALALEPGNADAVESLARLEAGRGRTERAIALLQQLVRMRPGDADAARALESLRSRSGSGSRP